MERIYNYDKFKDPVNCQHTTALQAGNTDFHMHDGYELYYLVDGEISYFVEQSCYHMQGGDMILFNNQEIHKATNLQDTPFTRMVIHLTPPFIRQLCTNQTNLLTCFQNRKPGKHNLSTMPALEQLTFQQLFLELHSLLQSRSFGDDLLSMTCLIQILVMVNREFDKAPHTAADSFPHKVQPIMNYIDDHLSDPLSLEGIAHNLCMDKYYLSHVFKQETESSIFQYVLVKRVALAKELLSQGHTVTETCQMAGFNDYSNFIRSFKKISGYTPGQFRKAF